MNKVKKLKFYIESLCVYDLKDDKIIKSLFELLKNTDNESVLKCHSDFFRCVSKVNSLKGYISSLILTNDNAFTKSCASSHLDRLPESVIDGVKSDLKKLEAISAVTAQDIIDCVNDDDIKEILSTLPCWKTGEPEPPLKSNWDEQIDDLSLYHKEHGYGIYSRAIAFSWRNHELYPLESSQLITLKDLKNYESQRQKVIDNTHSFVCGYPANNVLLYGDRGTGKSSTVHAVLNEYAHLGLRMIEISKSDIPDLTVIRELLSQSPMKFIIFIDDLCFDSHDDSFGELKAGLEGSLSSRKHNTLIYATSNRRHLIKESFSDRENDVNRNDIMQEQLSLSDRFGLSITFVNPNKKDYLDIVEKILADRKIEVDKQKLFIVAEQWASRKGGRSPRCARQFIDYVESCVAQGKDWGALTRL